MLQITACFWSQTSENKVEKVLAVLENKLLSPFRAALDENVLYNLSSGRLKEGSVIELLSIYEEMLKRLQISLQWGVYLKWRFYALKDKTLQSRKTAKKSGHSKSQHH